ncbi:PilZ domain-containing protein [Geothermobacter ehrlichii]|uniref:PilZ domain-containing protein n=1 Tax=Geothermobacter ehrlichii TaxID=213224 RepID=A0A5D3WLW2_9BACT|nr:PilZ domain-containing protein [Geothermobacter ehrlichii]TYO99264.1 PilZ domain-containing protein [Geothermobacter ehrlichii]
MLRMQCRICGNLIRSQLLTEMKSVYCRRCGHFQGVGELYVTARGFTMLRSHLLDRFRQWERLLRDALKEREMLEFSEHGHSGDAERLDWLIATLRELLDGARGHFRLCLALPTPVRCDCRRGEVAGQLINISIFGACVQLHQERDVPARGEEVVLHFHLPEAPHGMETGGRVVWVAGRPGRLPTREMGVEFEALKTPVRNSLWKYIIAHKDRTDPCGA